MFTKWLSQLFGPVRKGRRSPCVRRTPRPGARPWLETLESRYAPTVSASVIGTVLTVTCDNSANTVTVDHDTPTSSAIISGTGLPATSFSDTSYTSIDVEGPTGPAAASITTTNILALVAPLTNNTNNFLDVVNVGNAGSVSGIQGSVAVENEPSYTIVNVHDEGDAAAHTAVIDVVNRLDTPLGRLSGIGASDITWDHYDTQAVNLYFGSGTSTVNVLATGDVYAGITYATPTTIFNVAPATINVGNAGSLSGIKGTLNLENEPDYDTVVIDNSADAATHTATISTVTRSGGESSLGQLTGLSTGAITWDYLDTTSVTINSGTGFVIWHINGTGAGVPTTINATLGTNAFVFCQTSHDLSNIAGAVTVNGSGASDVVEFYDQANPGSETYTFDSIPSSLNLTNEPVSVNFTGVGAVYLETNGASTVVDPSGTVLVDTGTEPY